MSSIEKPIFPRKVTLANQTIFIITANWLKAAGFSRQI